MVTIIVGVVMFIGIVGIAVAIGLYFGYLR
jgi:hypothetical protein